MAALIGGPAAAWLAAHREELNARFERAQRRHPALSASSFGERLVRVLPPLMDGGSEALASSVYDLLLLHEGRGAFGSRPGLSALFEFGLPALRDHLLAAPRSLPGALSNAVEGRGEQGPAFVAGLMALGPAVQGPEQLQLAGAILAWRLGEARLRPTLLPQLERLPGPALLSALGLDWPAAAAPLAVAALLDDAWLRPEARFRDETLRLEDPVALQAAAERLGQDGAPRWALAGTLGDFRGFGGPLLRPGRLLQAGDRHSYYLREQDQDVLLIGDVYGWHGRPIARSEHPLAPAPGASATVLRGATSHLRGPRHQAATFRDTHRIRVLVPVEERG